MFERFKNRSSQADDGGHAPTAVERRPVAAATDRATSDPSTTARRRRPRPRVAAPRAAATRETMRHVRARQREEYGGINWGAAFFGWLVAVGVAVLLTGILAAAGAAIGLTETTSDAADSASPETLSLAGAIALLVVLAIAYYCGGYVAGRMSRFDGARQGIGAWAIGLLITLGRRGARRHRRLRVQRRRARQPAAPADRRRDAHHRRRDRQHRDPAPGRCCSPPSAASPAPATTARSTAPAIVDVDDRLRH